ncbi:hypothetical protein [Actinoallomurus sp. NPDC052274]|uniref:hypothetical protein n=1 Tax=Actinoallomurus sp. NPDC052274 TaxID=3155420 RepID=UPI0034219233
MPWKYIGKTIDARSTANAVQLFLEGELIKTHVRKPKGKQTDLNDYPPEKIAFFQRAPVWCRRRAAEVGPACVAVIEELLAGNALHHLRSAQGVLGLADRHDADRLEAACAKALTADDPSYRTIKGILAAAPDQAVPADEPAGDGGAAAFLRGPQGLFADNVVPLSAARSAEAS